MAAPNQPNREKEIFEQALDLPTPEQREAYLKEACGGDAALHARLEGLLRAQTQADDFLPGEPVSAGARTAIAAAVGALASDETLVPVVTEQSGDRIGRYKLLEKLGDGGFGVVYMAEQREPVKRRVALKIIKVGMDTREVVARFEAERQALALMDHPNIAKVFDAGSTERPLTHEPDRERSPLAAAALSKEAPGSSTIPPSDERAATGDRSRSVLSAGRPYFVMELVRGIRITDYCDQNQLGLEDRLKLFMQVCHAVQHAHQKGIIHRDLKPSNILVTLHDGVPVPKVIDFGIAKATQQELTEKTLFTQFHQFIGTPSYMSPEQAELSGLDIDTRSDIYSLGVLLYELLAGKPPFDGQELLKAGLDEMRRTLREVEPPRPSTRLTQELVAADVRKRTSGTNDESASSPRRLPRKELIHLLRGDLDWIVMKCLEKDRARRYETANGLAADLHRHLSNEPVVARPPSTVYRLQKLIRRNKLAFAAMVAVSVSLLAGIGVSTWQAVRATRAERKAQQQAEVASEQSETARAVQEFLTEHLLGGGVDVFGSPDTEAIDPMEAQALVERVARKVEGKFTNQPRVEVEIRAALARAFSGQNDYALIAIQNERLLELRQRLLGPHHSDTLEAVASLAYAKHHSGHKNEAYALTKEALAAIRASTNALSVGAGMVLLRQGRMLQIDSRDTEALPYVKEGFAVLKQNFNPTNSRHMIIKQAMGLLAHVTQQAGQWEAAETLWREVVQEYQRDQGAEHPMTVQAQFGLARLLVGQKRWEEGQSLLERVVAFNQPKLGTNHALTLDAQYWLGQAYEQKSDVDAAAALYADIFPRLVKHWPHRSAVYCCLEMANFYVRHRRYEEARAAYSAMSASWGDKPAETRSDFDELIVITAGARGWSAAAEVCRAHRDLFATSLSAWRLKATALFYAGDREGYRYAVGKALSLAAPTNSLEDQRTILTIAVLGWSALSPEQVKQCEAIMPSLEKELSAPSTNRHGRVHRTIGALQLRVGRTGEALEHLEQAVASLSGIERARVLVLQALCFQRLGRLEETRQALADAEAIMKSSFPDPLPKYEGLLEHWQLYELMLFREAQALLAGAEQKP